MTNIIVSSGVTSSGLSVLLNDVVQVLSGGIVSLLAVGSGGQDVISVGGTGLSTQIGSGGVEINAGGLTVAASVASGGLEVVLSGGLGTLATVAGEIDVGAGGTISGADLVGGVGVLSSGAVANLTTVLGGGSLIVLPGATANATVNVLGNVISTGDVVLSGGDVISTGNTLSGLFLGAGQSAFILPGGLELSALIGSGGIETVLSGGQAVSTTISAGLQTISGGGLTTSDVISALGQEIVLSGGSAVSVTILNTGTLTIDQGGAAVDINLGSGGVLDLAGLSLGSGATAVLNPLTDVLTVADGPVNSAFQLVGDYTGLFAHLNIDGDGGIGITVNGTPCYCRGTLIQTDRGEMPVESLRIGDHLVTHAGAMRPIRWIGQRSYAGAFAEGNLAVLPIRFAAGSLGDQLPRRDLLVSPLHAVFLEGVLIPAQALVNGHSVVQLDRVEKVEYFHIELDSHDVILAEGAAAESFVDDQSRGMFHNEAEFRLLYPELRRVPAEYCARRLEHGPEVQAARRAIAARFAERLPVAAGPLEGGLDHADHEQLCGWACDPQLETPVRLRVLDNGVVLGEVVADQYRADLHAALGDGNRGFCFDIPGGLSLLERHVIVVERLCDGAALPNAPWILEARPELAENQAVVTAQAGLATCQGNVEQATRGRVCGWAWDAAVPDAAIWLQILDNGRPVARVLANRFRADLADAGIGRGRHSFDVLIPGGLSPLSRHVIQVRREQDGTDLGGSPVVIERADRFDADLQQAVAGAVAALETDHEREHVLSFIAKQADRLLQQRADTASHRAERGQGGDAGLRPGPLSALPPAGLRALVIDDRMPVAGRDAGSQAILSHMRGLGRLGYQVTFIAADQIDLPASPDLQEAGITNLGAPFYVSVEEVLRRQQGCFDVVYLHRADVAARYMALARTYAPKARILYSIADLHHVRVERQARIEQRPELLGQARRLKLAECNAALSADAVLVHSPVELDMLRQMAPQANLQCVGWAVPRHLPRTSLADRRGLAFIGGYAHAPNVDAARYLVQDVMPLVWAEDPALSCMLVGSDMPEQLRRLAAPNVIVRGHVEQLGAVFDQVRLTVAPLRYGAGLKGKVLESFAAATPCVMSAPAAEGLTLCQTLRELVGVDAKTLAALILRLHRDDIWHARAIAAGKDLVGRHCDPAEMDAALAAAIGAAQPAMAVNG